MTLDPTEALPQSWRDIKRRSDALGFDMPSDGVTGALLRALAASKPGGRLLELGTGTGLGTACLLAGMDARASLVTVDPDASTQAVARDILGADSRVTFRAEDALSFMRAQPAGSFDLIFADAMPGKYEGLNDALILLRAGGIYVADDLGPQPNWPSGHQARVDDLIAKLSGRSGLAVAWLPCGTGHLIATRLA